MNLTNEKEQIKEIIARLNYYEKGLQEGKKVERRRCNLCFIAQFGCAYCLAEGERDLCQAGANARESISSSSRYRYDKSIIRKWQTELKRRANANLKATGSKWRIEWER